ncbi:MAG: ComF family protein [Bacteroidales bacterium]|jgi:ComF family protein|nr:ComF family protein [Bacteroidales bacterium]MDZ4058737.1 ComF family protein [Bacteroidales bacterium]
MGIGSLFFPDVCPVCDRLLTGGERHICIGCMADIPYSYFWSWRENPAEMLLRSRVKTEYAASLIYYRSESNWRSVIHRFKYTGDTSLGKYLAKLLGTKIYESGSLKDVDMVVPVPLHPYKRWIRGFNQATIIADSLGEVLNIPVCDNLLKRGRYNRSQTVKDRENRYKGAEGAFFVKKEEKLRGKHILLVDDVLTTGATIEACGRVLLAIEDTSLSVLTLAFVE